MPVLDEEDPLGGPLTVRFWGARGSYPTPGASTLEFGGNTACVEIRLGRRMFIIDAGSGFIRAGAVRVQVADTGPGISEEYLPHIFEPFFSTKGEKGTGLGLWVSLGIAQSHGGRLQVRNRPGGGTVFSMTLPIGGPAVDATAT